MPLPSYIQGDLVPDQYKAPDKQISSAWENYTAPLNGSTNLSTPSLMQSVGAALENTPLWQDLKGVTSQFYSDPNFDPSLYAIEASKTLGWEAAGKLADTSSKAEFDFRYAQYQNQIENSRLVSNSLLASAANIPLSVLSAQNIIAVAATEGVGLWGVAAPSLEAGLTSNAIRGAAASFVGSAVGAVPDVQSNLNISAEDAAWGTLLNSAFGAVQNYKLGRVYETVPAQEAGVFDLGGALGRVAASAWQRLSGEGYSQYVKAAAENQFTRQTFNSLTREKNHTGVFDNGMQPFDWTNTLEANKKITPQAIDEWWAKNLIDERSKHITSLERLFNQSPDFLNTLYGQLMKSGDREAQVLALTMLEGGTGGMVNNSSFAVVREALKGRIWDMYSSPYRTYLGSYSKRARALEEQAAQLTSTVNEAKSLVQNAKATLDRMTHYFKDKAAFDEEVVLYANYKRAGRVGEREWSPEVTKYFDDHIEKGNFFVHSSAQSLGLSAWDRIKFLPGYLHQRHVPEYYRRALAKFGGNRDDLVALIQKSLMSPRGQGIKDAGVAKKVARQFVRRFLDETNNVTLRNALPDEAWQMLEEELTNAGVNLDGGAADYIQGKIRKQTTERSKIKYAQSRMNLDLEAEHKGVRMMDLLDTDVENLLSSYAIHMSGQLALAKTGFKSYADFEAVLKGIEARNPKLKKQLNFLRSGVKFDRPDTVRSPFTLALVKAGSLAYLNNVGMAQLAESGTATMSLTTGSFLKSVGHVAQDMWRGRKTPRATKLAEELTQALYPIGREHWYDKPHLMRELSSNSSLAAVSLLDKAKSTASLALDAQGYTSGFNLIRTVQQKAAAEAYTNMVAAAAAEGGLVGRKAEFLASMGMSRDLMERITAQAKYATKKDGYYVFNVHKWDAATADEFTYTMVRMLHTMVQKHLLGESIPFMSSDAGSVLMQFMSYPMLAFRKQLTRNATLGGSALAAATLHSALVAGTAITARNYLTGADTEADLTRMLQNGISYSSTAGPVSQFWDLGISLTGAPQSLYANPWSGISTDLIAPPGIAAVNSWAKIPRALAHSAGTDGMSSDDLRAMRAIPLLGNHIFLSRLMR